MRDFERDELTPENEDQKPESSEDTKQEEASDSAPEEPKREEPKREEPPRDIYGRTYTEGYGSYHAPDPTPSPKKKKGEISMSGTALAMLLVCCMLVSILAGAGINYMFDGAPAVQTTGTSDESTASQTTSGDDTLSETTGTNETAPSISIGSGSVIGSTEFSDYERYATVANECIKSVVIIRVTESNSSGAGSGVIYTQDGYIVTNYHVVGDSALTISVELYDGTVYDARYIYGDEYVDLSVIKIEKNDCVPAKIGDSSQMALGQMVIAIGNPLGYGLTVTDGIISAVSRSVTVENTTMTLMQTSASINSGNSGGGLFNMNGELIGIVNAKISGTSVESMGYAIPSETVVKSLNDLKNYGYITGKARLGITVLTKQQSMWPYRIYTYIQVAEVKDNGSAANSGLQTGDILYKFNDSEITSYDVLSEQLTRYAVGDTITLTILRPTVELTNNNISEYLNTAKEIQLTITFVEFNPNE